MKSDILSLFNGNHIAIIGQKGIPREFVGTSGIEFYVEERAKELIKQKKCVTCYVRLWATPKTIQTYNGIQLIHLPSINTKHLDAFTHSLLSTIHACFSSCDIVWFQTIGPALFSPLVKICRKKVITTIHGLDWKRKKWGKFARLFLYLCEKILVKYSDHIIVVSRDLQIYYASQYGVQSYIDSLTIKRKPPVPPKIIKEKYNLQGNDYILYMGRFVPEKRIDMLIQAFMSCKKSRMKLVLSGGSSHTDNYETMLKHMSHHHDNIIFTGYVFGREKKELLSNCKVFILPSELEGNPIVIEEVKAYGRAYEIISANDNTFYANLANIILQYL